MANWMAQLREAAFPERNWSQLDDDQYEQVLKDLCRAGPENKEDTCGQIAAKRMQKHGVKLGYLKQKESAAGWTISGNVTLEPGSRLEDGFTLTLIIHEVFHLQQGILTRLSVYGELQAWQLSYQAYAEITGKRFGEPGAEWAGEVSRKRWDELSQLSPQSRQDLARAQELMAELSPGYRSPCLPLSPLLDEVWYHFRRGKFAEGLKVIQKLVSGL